MTAALGVQSRVKPGAIASHEITPGFDGVIALASINISESDFNVLATAANDAKTRGDQEQAEALDKIARKVNAALSKNHWAADVIRTVGIKPSSLSWRDMPSTILDR